MSLEIINLVTLNLHTIVGLTGVSLLVSASVLRVLLFFKVSRPLALFITLMVFSLSFLSVSGYSISSYLRGLFNDLSVSSLILLSYYVFSSSNSAVSETSKTQPVFILIALAGLFFYPTALGLGPVDPYSWGFIYKLPIHYSSFIFISCLAGLMVTSLIKQHSLLLLCLVLASLAYQLDILQSRNLWDYLFDPLIFIYALSTITRQMIKQIIKKLNPV